MEKYGDINVSDVADKLEKILMAAVYWNEKDCHVPDMDSLERQRTLSQAVKILRHLSDPPIIIFTKKFGLIED